MAGSPGDPQVKADLRNLTQTGERMAVWTVLEGAGPQGPSVSLPSPISVTTAWCHVPKTNPSMLGEIAKLTAKCSVLPRVNSGTLVAMRTQPAYYSDM